MDNIKTILFSGDRKNIYYDDDNAYDGTLPYKKEDLEEGVDVAEYAIKLMRNQYSKLLSRQFDNIVVLSGAGSSMGIGAGAKKGKTISKLWKKVVEIIGEDSLKKFFDLINFETENFENVNLEDLLSKAKISEAFSHKDEVLQIVEQIEKIIRDECTLALPDNSPHEIFLRNITSRKLKYSRVKIFTLNYDLLFEQAASKGGYVIIDGFSFTVPRYFNGVNYDYDIVIRNNQRSLSEENYAPKVFHLYKPHGSLDWNRIDGKVEKVNNPANPVMIYPSSHKYEASYEQPYFEMMSRFQTELRKSNTLLIVVGFSFYDKHIDAMISEAINSNPSLTLIIVAPDANESDCFTKYKKRALEQKGIYLVSETFENFSKNYPYSKIYDYSEDNKAYESIW